MILTLSTNGKPAYIEKDNISFMVEIEEENDQNEMMKFTRIFLKQIAANDVPPFVDIRESIKEVAKLWQNKKQNRFFRRF